MKYFAQTTAIYLLFGFLALFSACENKVEIAQNSPSESNNQLEEMPEVLLKVEKNERTDAPIGKFDFKNYTYPLPIGWQGGGIKEITLENGKFPMNEERIGATYLTTKFGDVTGDGQDEAMVVLKIETGGSAIPQIVYIFEWRDGKPEKIWHFRTGDRADGGLKDLRAENGELVIQLYGQDRYLLGELETMKITGDEEQICCPTWFTRTRYKWNGNVFELEGKRETYSIQDKKALPVENMIETLEENKSAKMSANK